MRKQIRANARAHIVCLQSIRLVFQRFISNGIIKDNCEYSLYNAGVKMSQNLKSDSPTISDNICIERIICIRGVTFAEMFKQH